jgi:hypothetical protein
VHVGGGPNGVAYLFLLDERQQIGDLQFPPDRLAIRLAALVGIDVIDNKNADRQVGGDDFRLRFALQPGGCPVASRGASSDYNYFMPQYINPATAAKCPAGPARSGYGHGPTGGCHAAHMNLDTAHGNPDRDQSRRERAIRVVNQPRLNRGPLMNQIGAASQGHVGIAGVMLIGQGDTIIAPNLSCFPRVRSGQEPPYPRIPVSGAWIVLHDACADAAILRPRHHPAKRNLGDRITRGGNQPVDLPRLFQVRGQSFGHPFAPEEFVLPAPTWVAARKTE